MKILLAVDGSRHAEEAAWLLSRLPHRDSIELTLLTVLAPPVTAFYSPTRQFMDEIIADDRRFARQQQQQIAAMFQGANVTLDRVILEGHVNDAIVDVARQREVDLVVLGAKGHSQIDRILLGSTSDYVATHAHCSVLVVRPTGLREEPHRNLRVSVAYDNSSAARGALTELLEFQWGPHTELTVVAVAGYTPVFNPDFGFNAAALRREAESAMQEASKQLRPHAHTVHEQLIEHDHIAEGLVQYTEQTHSDFLVIGDTGRSTLARALLGSVSRFVLRHASCGVWITRHTRTTPQSATDADAEASDSFGVTTLI